MEQTAAEKKNPNWFDDLEILAIELEMFNSKKCLACVRYRPPLYNALNG
jgi:hypothetical protein